MGFEEAQEKYETVLSQLNRLSSAKAAAINGRKSLEGLIEEAKKASKLALLEALQLQKADIQKHINELTTKLQGVMKEWREWATATLPSDGDVKCTKDQNMRKLDDDWPYSDKTTYGDYLKAVSKYPDGGPEGAKNLERAQCGEISKDGKLEIHYCPEEYPICCDQCFVKDADGNLTEDSFKTPEERGDPDNSDCRTKRAMGTCFKPPESGTDPDMRCRPYHQGNHAANHVYHYGYNHWAGCDLRKHKYQQRGMWRKLFQAYAAFRKYWLCLCPYRHKDWIETSGRAPECEHDGWDGPLLDPPAAGTGGQ